MSDVRRSNCLIEALRAWWVLRAQGHVVYLWVRPSRYAWSPFHMGWALWDVQTDGLRVYSFQPVSPRNVPWYLAWTRVLFRGHVVVGDAPATALPTPAVPGAPDRNATE